MFVNNEITDRGLLHKLLRAEARKVTPDERALWAHSIDGAIKDATRPSTILRLRLTHPDVVAAAAPSLSAVAGQGEPSGVTNAPRRASPRCAR